MEWVQELRTLAPTDYLGLTTLSLIQTTDNAAAAIEAAKLAINALPVDKTAYRALIHGAFHDCGNNQLAVICRQYSNAQVGDLDPWYSPTYELAGQGIRTFALAFNGDEPKPAFALSHGVKLGHPARNIFDIDSTGDSRLMRLILPFVPGIKMKLIGIDFRTTKGIVHFSSNQLRVLQSCPRVCLGRRVVDHSLPHGYQGHRLYIPRPRRWHGRGNIELCAGIDRYVHGVGIGHRAPPVGFRVAL